MIQIKLNNLSTKAVSLNQFNHYLVRGIGFQEQLQIRIRFLPFLPHWTFPKQFRQFGHSYPDFLIFGSLLFASFTQNSCSCDSTIHTIEHSNKVVDENSFSTRNNNLVWMSNNTRVLEREAILKETFDDAMVL